MSPELVNLLYLLGAIELAVVLLAAIATGARLNTDIDEAEQERIERERLPIMLRRQAD